MKKTHRLRGIILLFITATIWGTAFVAQSVGLDHLGSFTFNGIRSLIGCIVLLPFILFQDRKQQHTGSEVERKTKRQVLLVGGTICGIMLCIASNLQQFGITHSTVGKSAFITTLYIVLVPLLGLFLKHPVKLQIWFSVLLALVGLYLLCMKDEGFQLGIGDVYLILCALFFSFQIIAVDYYAPKVNGLKLSCMQFFVTAVLSGIFAAFTERPSWADITAAAFPLFYAGAISCGIGYTLQIVAQKDVNPTVASLIMSLESVIASLAGWILLHETLSTKELIGCGLVFGAVILTQLPAIQKRKAD